MEPMPALLAGEIAPDFRLFDADGEEFHLSDQLHAGPVLVTFFKTNCPTCQYGLPFLDRFESALESTAAQTVAVCQDSPSDASRFSADLHYSGRILFDTLESGFPVSNAYRLTNVPSVFLIQQDGRIAHAVVGWSKSDVEEIAAKLHVPAPFRPNEDVLPFRPG